MPSRYWLLLAVWAWSACTHLPSREELLIQQSGAYHNDVRWKRFGEASIRVVPWKQRDFLTKYRKSGETLQIEDHELQDAVFPQPGHPGYAEDPTMATLRFYRYQYEMPDVTRQKIELTEEWIYNGEAWFIDSGW